MPKQVIVIMQDHYPFGECEECTNEQTRVLVRKIYQVGMSERKHLLQKVGVLRRLKNQHMIKVQSVLEEQQTVHLLFEYIPIKLQTWISNINDEFIENFRDQLIKFSSFLANSSIKTQFQLKNIGMDQNYGAKYFLHLDFEIDRNTPKEKLKSNYIREITNLFRPYIMSANISDIAQHSLSKDHQAEISMLSNNKDVAISPPTNKQQSKNKVKKQHTLEKYYQQVNMSVDSENQKILQEFMDVLDNDQDGKPVHSSPVIHNNNSFNKNRTMSVEPGQVVEQYANNPNNRYSALATTMGNKSDYHQHNSEGKLVLNRSVGGSRIIMNIAQYQAEAAQLRIRVKVAIEKSVFALKKYKGIKDE